MAAWEQPIDHAAVEAEIELIRSLDIHELRTRWRKEFKATPPKGLTKDLLGRMLAYRLQEQVYGGLDRATLKLLESYVRGSSTVAERERRLRPGTVLVREYQGERHTVTVVRDGFVWRERTFASLSAIARSITGIGWNGPRFFGLRTLETGSGTSASGEAKTERTGRATPLPSPRTEHNRASAVPAP